MADQLVGVLREIVARHGGAADPRPSTLFSGDFRARPDRPDYRRLPVLRVNGDDPAAGYLATLSAAAPADLVRLLRGAPDQTVEVRLRLARELIDVDEWDEVAATLDEIAADDAWEWRVAWLRGIAELARGRPERAAPLFHEVYCEVPGELAPKLALAVAFESAGDHAAARPAYETVSRIDPSFTTAAFGLARCCLALGDRAGALAAYARVQESSSTYTESRVATIRCLIDGDVADLVKADAILQAVDVDPEQRSRLKAEVLARAIERLDGVPAPHLRVAGCALEDRSLRTRARGGLPRARAPRAERGRARPARGLRQRGAPEDVDMSARCDACDALLVAGDHFCEECGARVGDAPTEDEHVPEGRVELDLGAAAAISDQGRVHHRNEDAFHLELVGDAVVAVVCDGVSTAASGDVAARDRGAGRGRGARGRRPRRRGRPRGGDPRGDRGGERRRRRGPGGDAPHRRRGALLHAGLRGLPSATRSASAGSATAAPTGSRRRRAPAHRSTTPGPASRSPPAC